MKQCYFCHERLTRATPDNDSIRYVCQKHPMGWVWHYYRKGIEGDAEEISKVYFPVQREGGDYGFTFRPGQDSLVLSYWARDKETGNLKGCQEILRLNEIPDNLNPETAQEKLSFYLTYY